MNAVYNLICIVVKYAPVNSKPNSGPNLLSQKRIRTDKTFFDSKLSRARKKASGVKIYSFIQMSCILVS